MRTCLSRSVVSVLVLLAALAASAGAAREVPESAYRALHWRSVGPLRGGWATVACGVPGAPHTFYFGAADGGVWKTTDAGRTWRPSFQHQSVASIGALVVAPSAPQVLYVGTGQVTTRWDVTSGDGVYRSSDGGATWEHRGLVESEHVGRIWVDPRDPNVLLVAALGHLFGPNPERGVFRSTDGGAIWSKVLFVDDETGAVDLAADPRTPDVVLAATWRTRQYPWQSYFLPTTGAGSAIWRSTDAGRTWTRVTDGGLPKGAFGRIGLAFAPSSNGKRAYATIDAEQGAGLYRSDDSGVTWRQVNADGDLASDYFSMVAVDPRDADVLHVMGRSIRTSTDGGATFRFTRGSPGGDDYHFLWIDPEHPERRIAASDQGAVVTLNDGESWSSWYNQPTGQFYRLAADDRFPYWIYSGQQDSGTAAVASRSDYGQLTFRDWHPVGGDERDYDVPFPGEPEIVFGSGLGGRLSRFDSRTGQVRVVSPWPVSSYGARPTTVRYRSTWLTPFAISPLAPHALYQGAQVLFRSLDGGETWATISPDLTGAVPGTPDCDGDVPLERATACGYGTIFSIGLSPLDANLIWIGSDNGFVHVTQDGGATWKDVSPKGLPVWSKIASLDASRADPATVYAAVERHRVDDWTPCIYVTHDFGATWRRSDAGLPPRAYVNVVRHDPARAGLLYAGTSRGVHVSFDDGAHWQSLQNDLPTTGVNDLLVHGRDLAAATEGRGLWILDDVSPLRALDAGALAAGAVLVPPATAWRLAPNQNRDTPLPVDEPRAENPPSGAVIDYVLASEPRGRVTLEIVDASGAVVREFASDAVEDRPHAGQYFPDDWVRGPEPLPARAGHNRFVWNLRLERPRALEYEFAMAAVPGVDTPALPQGMFVLPARYTVRLTVDGKTLTQPLTVEPDPRVAVPATTLVEQARFYREVVESLERATDARVEVARIVERVRELDDEARPREVRDAARKLVPELERFESGPAPDGSQGLARIAGKLGSLATDVEGCDATPTAPQRELAAEQSRELDAALARWRAFRARELRAFDEAIRKAGLPSIGP